MKALLLVSDTSRVDREHVTDRKGGWLPKSLRAFLNDPRPVAPQPADA